MKSPVVAAIPNYNMAPQLGALLPELARQNYADIVVLDDASTDGSREIVEDFNAGATGVHFVASTENRGAGAARNLIVPTLRNLGYGALIHFMDADITLETASAPEVAQAITPDEPFGFVGGLARNSNGMQSVWNYGPRQDVRALLGGLAQMRMEQLIAQDSAKAHAFRHRHRRLLTDWPDPLSTPVRRPIFWNVEQNLLVSSDIFEDIGGFDENLREHEIQDLAIRMHNAGLPRLFDPAISVCHLNGQNVRNYNRATAMRNAERYIARKHGLGHWLIHSKQYDPLYSASI
jgi:GT2 family glycosyltransferase